MPWQSGRRAVVWYAATGDGTRGLSEAATVPDHVRRFVYVLELWYAQEMLSCLQRKILSGVVTELSDGDNCITDGIEEVMSCSIFIDNFLAVHVFFHILVL